MNVLSLFDGISCAHLACDKAGLIVDKYYASEIDKFAIKVTQSNYPNTIQMGDVSDWESWDIDWSSIDLVIGGFPCQSFSMAGAKLGFEDERAQLFFHQVNIINHVKSVNPDVKFIVENVTLMADDRQVVNSLLGVKPVEINSNLLSAQNRARLYWCNWHVTRPIDKDIRYQSILDDGQAILEKAHPLTATYYKRGSEDTRLRQWKRSQRPIVWLPDGSTRWLNAVECERLQTVPEGYTQAVSDTRRLELLGNAFTVDVIAHILNCGKF